MTFMGFRCPALVAVGTVHQPNWTEAEADACRGKWTAGSPWEDFGSRWSVTGRDLLIIALRMVRVLAEWMLLL